MAEEFLTAALGSEFSVSRPTEKGPPVSFRTYMTHIHVAPDKCPFLKNNPFCDPVLKLR